MLITAFLLATAVSAPATKRADECESRFMRTGSSTSIHSDSDDDRSILSFTSNKDGICQSATIVGKIGYSQNEDDIISMPFGSYARFSERTASMDRELSITRGVNGDVTRAYQVNGRPATYDADARKWLGGFLPHLLAVTGVNAGPRVARWRSEGGVDNALKHIETLESSGAMRAHYSALLDDGRLSSGDLQKTLGSVTDNMRGSSGDMSTILIQLASRAKITHQEIPSLERAITSIPSSGDKTRVLQAYSGSDDRDLLIAIMRIAESIPSSGDRTRLLQMNASRYLRDEDNTLHDAFFHVAASIPSSGDMRNVLQSATPYASRNENIARQIIATARRIPSSGDRSAVMIDLIQSGAIRTPALREAFLQASAEIPSDGDRARVLRAAVEARGT